MNPAELLTTPACVDSCKTIATLWSSYGHIYRLQLRPDSSLPRTAILKVIRPPDYVTSEHDESNLRKLISYRVERHFYTVLLPSASLPACTHIAASYPAALTPASRDVALLLSDLSPEFPASAPGYLNLAQAKVVLKWLAGFHGTFKRRGALAATALVPPPLDVSAPASTAGVWAHGSWWYLATRQSEHADMDAEHDFLRPWAEKAAAALADPAAPGRTLLHGDLKAANIVFSQDGKECAAYDFQYVGAGLGVVDLVYLLATSVERRVVGNDGVVEELVRAWWEGCREVAGEGAEGWTWEVMWKQMDVAVVDWFRLMAGWGFWGNGVFVTERKVKGIVERWEREGMGLGK